MDVDDDDDDDAEEDGPKHRCLVRARTEKKKISTVVEAKDLLKFHTSLSNILKVSTTTLKRKERTKEKKKGDKKEDQPTPAPQA
mmetsp:Transcript_7037/g.23057  ORF Transcript_7037/g.23057 Transcript_7037/m.23057 type:complete len:84 (+) Transcript_7037:2021-2272(+)